MKLAKMLVCTLAVSAFVSSAAAQSLDGVWTGAYWGGGNPATTFQATIDDTAGPGFSGTMIEPNQFTPGQSAFLLSNIEGSAAGARVSFTKTYDGTGGQSHSVTYQGELVSPRRIVGDWALGELTGQFELVR